MDNEIINETLHLKLAKPRRAKAKLFLYEFEDNGFHIAYNKSLELSAYGKTAQEAQYMFVHIVFKDFCENLMALSEAEIFAELKRLGWTRNSMFKKELSNTALVDKEGILRNFNLAENAKINEQYVAV